MKSPILFCAAMFLTDCGATRVSKDYAESHQISKSEALRILKDKLPLCRNRRIAVTDDINGIYGRLLRKTRSPGKGLEFDVADVTSSFVSYESPHGVSMLRSCVDDRPFLVWIPFENIRTLDYGSSIEINRDAPADEYGYGKIPLVDKEVLSALISLSPNLQFPN